MSKDKEEKIVTTRRIGAVKDVEVIAEPVAVAEDVFGSAETIPVKQSDLWPTTYLQIDMPANVNSVVGNPHAGDWGAIKHALKVLTSEFNELTKNVNEQNFSGIADDIADLLFTTFGFAYASGHLENVQENFYRVCEGQYGKFDTNSSDAETTRKKYTDKGIVVHTDVVKHGGVTFWVCKSSIEQPEPGRDVPMPAGKWLKSYKFVEPVMIQPAREISDKFNK